MNVATSPTMSFGNRPSLASNWLKPNLVRTERSPLPPGHLRSDGAQKRDLELPNSGDAELSGRAAEDGVAWTARGPVQQLRHSARARSACAEPPLATTASHGACSAMESASLKPTSISFILPQPAHRREFEARQPRSHGGQCNSNVAESRNRVTGMYFRDEGADLGCENGLIRVFALPFTAESPSCVAELGLRRANRYLTLHD